VQEGYTLNVSIKMFPYPVNPMVRTFEDSENLYNISLDNPLVTSDPQSWVKGLIYWNITRGINVDGVGMNKEKIFDFFIDYKGVIYDSNGDEVSTQEDLEKLKDAERGAYLGTVSSGEGVTEEARKALEKLESLGTGVIKTATAKIKATPFGWLRVRETPSLNGAEIARVNSGESYKILERGEGWIKIRVSDTVEGWVSEAYVELSE